MQRLHVIYFHTVLRAVPKHDSATRKSPDFEHGDNQFSFSKNPSDSKGNSSALLILRAISGRHGSETGCLFQKRQNLKNS